MIQPTILERHTFPPRRHMHGVDLSSGGSERLGRHRLCSNRGKCSVTLDFHLFGPGNHRPQWRTSREINFLLQHEARIPTSNLGSSSSEGETSYLSSERGIRYNKGGGISRF